MQIIHPNQKISETHKPPRRYNIDLWHVSRWIGQTLYARKHPKKHASIDWWFLFDLWQLLCPMALVGLPLAITILLAASGVFQGPPRPGMPHPGTSTSAQPQIERVAGRWYRETMLDGTKQIAHFRGRLPNKKILPIFGNLLGDEWLTLDDNRAWIWCIVVKHGNISTAWIDP